MTYSSTFISSHVINLGMIYFSLTEVDSVQDLAEVVVTLEVQTGVHHSGESNLNNLLTEVKVHRPIGHQVPTEASRDIPPSPPAGLLIYTTLVFPLNKVIDKTYKGE